MKYNGQNNKSNLTTEASTNPDVL